MDKTVWGDIFEKKLFSYFPIKWFLGFSGVPSWITKWKENEDYTIRGYPAYFWPFMGVVAGWTGASKLLISRKKNEIMELTEAFGYRRKRNIALDSFDSLDVKLLPNQYLYIIGLMTIAFWGLGLLLIIWSYWRKQVFVVINFGLKSTTNERVAIRVSKNDDWIKDTTALSIVLYRQRISTTHVANKI